ncbi:hypothetical protein HBH70_182790 [Parastagonospora nodorum]|nr:hypothetical protein HBH70_182790 [Parastagonospora nodorum]
MQRVKTVLILILSLLNDAEVSSPANADTRVAKTLRSMRSISINNNLLRHEQIACCKVQRLIVAYMRSKRRKMRCNYNPKTRLQNNNRYAKAIVYSARQSNTVNNAP